MSPRPMSCPDAGRCKPRARVGERPQTAVRPGSADGDGQGGRAVDAGRGGQAPSTGPVGRLAWVPLAGRVPPEGPGGRGLEDTAAHERQAP